MTGPNPSLLLIPYSKSRPFLGVNQLIMLLGFCHRTTISASFLKNHKEKKPTVSVDGSESIFKKSTYNRQNDLSPCEISILYTLKLVFVALTSRQTDSSLRLGRERFRKRLEAICGRPTLERHAALKLMDRSGGGGRQTLLHVQEFRWQQPVDL